MTIATKNQRAWGVNLGHPPRSNSYGSPLKCEPENTTLQTISRYEDDLVSRFPVKSSHFTYEDHLSCVKHMEKFHSMSAIGL